MDDSGERRYQTLSGAVRAGCKKYPVPSGASAGRRGALQAVWVAEFDNELQAVAAILARRYPELLADFGGACPFGPSSQCSTWPPSASRTMDVAVIHLEDVHGLFREEVADWLEARGL